MSLHQRTKEERREIAIKSEEILKKDPRVTLKKLASRWGLTYSGLYIIRKEFGLPGTATPHRRRTIL